MPVSSISCPMTSLSIAKQSCYILRVCSHWSLSFERKKKDTLPNLHHSLGFNKINSSSPQIWRSQFPIFLTEILPFFCTWVYGDDMYRDILECKFWNLFLTLPSVSCLGDIYRYTNPFQWLELIFSWLVWFG